MSAIFTVTLNGKLMLEFDKHSRIPGQQLRFLDKMDLDMANGVSLGNETIESPTLTQRAYYVAMTLLGNLEQNNSQMVSMCCAYLANRIPDLTELRASEDGDSISLELIY